MYKKATLNKNLNKYNILFNKSKWFCPKKIHMSTFILVNLKTSEIQELFVITNTFKILRIVNGDIVS